VAAVTAAREGVRCGKRLYSQLSFFLSAGGFGATVTASKLFHAPGGIHKLLFACEKWMATGTNTDLNIATSGAGVIDRAARADDIGFVIFWMDAGFHLRNGVRNLIAPSHQRKV